MKTTKNHELELDVDTQVYPLEAIQNACYSFIDRAHVRIASAGEKQARVCLKPKTSLPESGLETLSGDFHNELLHQALRLRVSEQNQKIREFIVTKALVSAQPADRAAEGQVGCTECDQPGGAAMPAPLGEAAPAPVDAELEAEIEKLLAEIEKSDGDKDPLKVAVPWEETHAAQENPSKAEADPGETGVPAQKERPRKKGAR